jgi:hypothetical protein
MIYVVLIAEEATSEPEADGPTVENEGCFKQGTALVLRTMYSGLVASLSLDKLAGTDRLPAFKLLFGCIGSASLQDVLSVRNTHLHNTHLHNTHLHNTHLHNTHLQGLEVVLNDLSSHTSSLESKLLSLLYLKFVVSGDTTAKRSRRYRSVNDSQSAMHDSPDAGSADACPLNRRLADKVLLTTPTVLEVLLHLVTSAETAALASTTPSMHQGRSSVVGLNCHYVHDCCRVASASQGHRDERTRLAFFFERPNSTI